MQAKTVHCGDALSCSGSSCNKTLPEASEDTRRTLQAMLVVAQRELALLDSALFGLQAVRGPFGFARRHYNGSLCADRLFQRQFEASGHPYLLLDPRPGLHIVDINEAYACATATTRAAVAGQPLFEIFPDNPDDPVADGVSNLYASLRIAAENGQPHTMRVQRYDVRGPDGAFIERYWRPLNTPVFDEEGHLVYMLHHVEDVTGKLRPTVSPDVGAFNISTSGPLQR